MLPQAHNSTYTCFSKVGQHTTGVGTSYGIISTMAGADKLCLQLSIIVKGAMLHMENLKNGIYFIIISCYGLILLVLPLPWVPFPLLVEEWWPHRRQTCPAPQSRFQQTTYHLSRSWHWGQCPSWNQTDSLETPVPLVHPIKHDQVEDPLTTSWQTRQYASHPTIHQSHLIYRLPHKHTHLWNHVYSDIITCASLEVYVKQPASHSSEHWLQSNILIGRVELCFHQTEIVRIIQPQLHSTGESGEAKTWLLRKIRSGTY